MLPLTPSAVYKITFLVYFILGQVINELIDATDYVIKVILSIYYVHQDMARTRVSLPFVLILFLLSEELFIL
jgi:hypothetical protein